MAGAAIGVGWQEAVAYVNFACYDVFGIPLGLLIGYKFKWGVKVIKKIHPLMCTLDLVKSHISSVKIYMCYV